MASKQAKRTVIKRATEIKKDKVIKGTLATHNHANNKRSTASSSGIPLPQPEVWKVTSNTISYGCDFAGLGTMGVALDILFNQFTKAGVKPMPYKLKYAFACDILRASEKLIKSSTTPPLRWDTDILQRPPLNIERGQLGLYSFTSPCQGLSSAGKKLGASDPRTQLFFAGVAIVELLQPKAFISENVATLVTWSKFRPFFDMIVSALKGAGYTLDWKIIDSADYVPQHRERLYLVGIRNDCLRKQDRTIPMISPPPNTSRPTIRQLVASNIHAANFQGLPYIRDYGQASQDNVIAAYNECGCNPYQEAIIVDMKCSEAFRAWRLDESPCLTKSRSSQMGYWYSLKGGPLTGDDMARLQGFRKCDLPDWKSVASPKALLVVW